MHRHSVRAFVAGVHVDVPVNVFVAGQYVRYIQGAGLMTTALAPGTTTPYHVATWGDLTATQLHDVPVTIDDAGNITGVNKINGTDPGDWVSGPPSSTESVLATWNGTTGRLLRSASTITSVGGQIREVDEINSIGVTEHGLGVGPANLLSSVNSMTLGDTTISNVTALDGVDPLTWVVGPASATDGHIALFNGASGKIIKQSVVVIDAGGNITGVNAINGTPPGNWMKGAASSVADRLVTYADTTGKQASNAATVTATGGTLGNVTQLNSMTVGASTLSLVSAIDGVDPLTWVVGPNSATNNRLATFNGTTGKLIQENTIITASGGALANVSTINGTDPSTWVQGPTSATSRAVAVFNGTTGKVITDTLVSIDTSGNISGGTYNGVSVPAHEARHLPGGADAIFGTDFNVSASPQSRAFYPLWNGSGGFSAWWNAALTNNNSNVTTSSYSWSQNVPQVNGHGYVASWVIALQPGDTTAVTVSVTVGSGSGRWVLSAIGIDQGAAVGSSLSVASPSALPMVLRIDAYLLINGATSNSYTVTITAGLGFTVAAYPTHRINQNI